MSFETDFFQSASKIFTVAELTRQIRGALETKFGAVWVQGEISNYKLHPSGHQYFTLKDQRAQIACVIFRNTLPASARPPSDGAQVQVYGGVSLFEARGQYQLNVQILQSRGLGLLQAKFEALKRKLDAEGLFDPARKRALPKFPRRIGIVTSASGAAIRDMLNVLQRRAPNVYILINSVRVQGSGAAAEIATAIRELATPSEHWPPLDLLVVARGGGSLEDLWEFNEEIVAQAIFDSAIPVVSAIGHEIDFTIADFVADLRAPTPSAAAELIVRDVIDLKQRIDELAACLHRNIRNCLEHGKTRLRFLSDRTLARELLKRIRDAQQQIDLARDALVLRVSLKIDTSGTELTDLQRRFVALPFRFYEMAQQRFRRVEGLLRVLGPEATLGRGYSITTREDGTLLRSVSDVTARMKVRTRLADGEFLSAVEKKTATDKTQR